MADSAQPGGLARGRSPRSATRCQALASGITEMHTEVREFNHDFAASTMDMSLWAIIG